MQVFQELTSCLRKYLEKKRRRYRILSSNFETEDYNVMIDGPSFLDQLVNNGVRWLCKWLPIALHILQGIYVVNLDEYKSIGTHLIVLYKNGNN